MQVVCGVADSAKCAGTLQHARVHARSLALHGALYARASLHSAWLLLSHHPRRLPVATVSSTCARRHAFSGRLRHQLLDLALAVRERDTARLATADSQIQSADCAAPELAVELSHLFAHDAGGPIVADESRGALS